MRALIGPSDPMKRMYFVNENFAGREKDCAIQVPRKLGPLITDQMMVPKVKHIQVAIQCLHHFRMPMTEAARPCFA